jgi:hypothetical protein
MLNHSQIVAWVQVRNFCTIVTVTLVEISFNGNIITQGIIVAKLYQAGNIITQGILVAK